MGALERRPTWKTHRFKESLGTDQSEWSYGVPRVRRGRNGFQAKRIEFLFFFLFFFSSSSTKPSPVSSRQRPGLLFIFCSREFVFSAKKKKLAKKKGKWRKNGLLARVTHFASLFFALSLFFSLETSPITLPGGLRKKKKKKRKKKRFDKQKPKQQSE